MADHFFKEKSMNHSTKSYISAFGALCIAIVLVSTVALGNKVSLVTQSFADGNGSPTECLTAVDVQNDNPVLNSVSYTDPEGYAVTGVCIKSGNNMFGGTMHSGVLTQNGDYENGCYTVSGIGTATVTVTHNGSGRNCQDISHIDIVVPEGEQEPTPTPQVDPTASPSADPTATPSAQPTATPDPGTGGGSNNSSPSNESKSEGQILSASTMAPTGIFDSIATATSRLFGVLSALSGSVLYVKKRFIG